MLVPYLFYLLLICVSAFGLYIIGKKSATTDWGHSLINCLDGLNHYLCRYYHRQASDLIPLPETGPAILIANHVSGLDPLILISATKRPLRFMVAQEEYDRWWLTWLFKSMQCIPVKRDKNPKKALAESLAALEQGHILVIFPQGEIVKNDTGKPLKKGAFVLSELSKTPITVVRINGVRGRGLNVSAVFIRSKISLVVGERINQVDKDKLKSLMESIKVFFFAQQ